MAQNAIRDLGEKATKQTKGVSVYYVYILTNKTNSVMYTGITNDLQRRVLEHKDSKIEGFTKNTMYINSYITKSSQK